MSPLPTVTALVPAYDAERFVGEAIDSALAQDYPAELLDVVVVDDGSRDATAEVVAERAARSAGRVTLIRQPNRGNPVAVSRAVQAARGEHVALLDADDAWPADKLRRQVDVLHAHPEVSLVYGDMRLIDTEGATLEESWLGLVWPGEPPSGHCFSQLLVANAATASTLLLRGSVARAITPIPAGILAADWWLVVRAAQAGEVAYLREPRTLYRFHGDNIGLGAEGERLRRSLQRRAILQRWYLRRLAPGTATAEELAAVWDAFEHNASEISRLGDSAFAAILDVNDDDRMKAAELLAQARTQAGAEALATIIRAAATDPFNAPAREALATTLA